MINAVQKYMHSSYKLRIIIAVIQVHIINKGLLKVVGID
jgi:hypothetical protein